MTRLLEVLVAAELLRARGRQRSDSPRVLAYMRLLTRLILVAETLRTVLNDRATFALA